MSSSLAHPSLSREPIHCCFNFPFPFAFAFVLACLHCKRAKTSRLLLRDATYVGDEEHLDFFGGRSLPVMLACPSRTLEVMPYALAARTEDAGLCVCDLQVGGREGRREGWAGES